MRNSGRGLLLADGGGGCSPQDCAGRSLCPAEARNSLCVRMQPPQAATRKHFINTLASAQPAAEAISDKGRPRRRSVENRRTFSMSRGQSRTCSGFAEARKRLRKRTFDCFKSAEGIRFSAGARTAPKSFHRGTFWLHLLGDKRWKYHIKYLRLFRVAQFAAAPLRRTATRRWLAHVLRRRRTAVSAGCRPNNFAAARRYLRRLALKRDPRSRRR